MQGSRGQQRHSVALVAVANTRNVPWPLVATAHLSMGAVEQAQPRRVQGVRFVDADRQWRFDVSEDKHGAEANGDWRDKRVPNLRLDLLERCIGRPIADGQMRRKASRVFSIVELTPGLDACANVAGDNRDEHPSRSRGLHTRGTVSFVSTTVQPNREPLSPERFLTEAAQLHQTWIRRFDAQHRRRPRPPEIEAERLRLVRRLQLVQRLQQEANDDPVELLSKLRALEATPREARLVEGDQPFLVALLSTWEAAQLPQASTIAAGANPPKPSGTVEFRW